MRRSAEHINICAGTEDTRLQTSNDNGLHFRMLKTNSLNRVGEFYVNAEIVRIEFEFVSIGKRLIFLHVHRKCCDRVVNREAPVFVLFRRSLKVDHQSQ